MSVLKAWLGVALALAEFAVLPHCEGPGEHQRTDDNLCHLEVQIVCQKDLLIHITTDSCSPQCKGLGIIVKDGVERLSEPEVMGVYGKHLDTVGQLHICIHSVCNSMHKTYRHAPPTPGQDIENKNPFYLKQVIELLGYQTSPKVLTHFPSPTLSDDRSYDPHSRRLCSIRRKEDAMFYIVMSYRPA
ncbi:hypothetical protein STEG23_036148 [Scotinomys teguina]